MLEADLQIIYNISLILGDDFNGESSDPLDSILNSIKDSILNESLDIIPSKTFLKK